MNFLFHLFFFSSVVFLDEIFGQQSSVQIQKIQADPPNPNVGEGLKVRCFLINVDPFGQFPIQVLWSIKRFSELFSLSSDGCRSIMCFI